MTVGEIFLEYLKPDGHPERQLKQYEAFSLVKGAPTDVFLRGNRVRGTTSKDQWGTTILFPEDAPGATPHVTADDKVCPDITHWRDYVKAPDLLGNCLTGWEHVHEQVDHIHSEGKLVLNVMGTGLFEQCHFLMGFEDTLTNFYEHPQEMHELIAYILEHRLLHAKILIENMHPDVILSHDDWGTKTALFMQPDIWREFFKEPYRKFYSYILSQGVIPIHHADSYLVPILEDMIEIGIPGWQGILPENDIPKVIRQLNGRMLVMGGIGAVIDRADSTEEEIYQYVMKTLERNCPMGHYLPCITYGGPGTVFPHVDPVINQAIDDYNQLVHLPDYRPAYPVRRKKAADATDTNVKKQTSAKEVTILDKLSLSIQRGQQKRMLQLCDQALEEGHSPQNILSEGLVPGMVSLGEDFIANRVFVPEMLMAAKCMNAATEKLKPLMVEEAGDALGKVCIGTVLGDMHDIGKNLVKIMMEGSGLEVLDLGVNVSAEEFIQTAIQEKCNIIVCSSLLTTTMPEMRKVVDLAVSEGIRDNVIIMVGGAPISQSFCDEIGADIYTADAASAAKAAVKALAG